ncbi:hypothetical protein J6590_040589 [Homalodisca vitripennis]|nr:hypothetical protein J6590_040589 [Homalodisca vitripennis]
MRPDDCKDLSMPFNRILERNVSAKIRYSNSPSFTTCIAVHYTVKSFNREYCDNMARQDEMQEPCTVGFITYYTATQTRRFPGTEERKRVRAREQDQRPLTLYNQTGRTCCSLESRQGQWYKTHFTHHRLPPFEFSHPMTIGSRLSEEAESGSSVPSWRSRVTFPPSPPHLATFTIRSQSSGEGGLRHGRYGISDTLLVGPEAIWRTESCQTVRIVPLPLWMKIFYSKISIYPNCGTHQSGSWSTKN